MKHDRARCARSGDRIRTASVGVSAVLVGMFASNVGAGPGDLASCTGLTALQLPNTTITAATYVAPTSLQQGYCRVLATTTPQTDIEVRLPDQWQGRYLHFGGGGFDGRIPNLDRLTPGPVSLGVGVNPLLNGFALVGSNGGHRASSFPGATFATDKTLTLNYASGALQESDLVGKAAVAAYYGVAAKYRYFAGCSNGGKNASVAMAVLGDDYDGVVSGDGVYGHSDEDTGGSDMSGMTAAWARAQQQVPISPGKGALVYQAQLAACDASDGVADGILSNPQACRFDPAVLRCTGASNDGCLTDAEIAAVNTIRSDLNDANGRLIGAPYGLGNPAQAAPSTQGLSAGFLAMAFRVPAFDPKKFDLARDFPTTKQVLDNVYGMSGSLEGMLGYLKHGKLIVFHGWDDMLVQPYVSTRLYDRIVDRGGKLADNARLYMVAGMGHCAGGVGADSADLLGAMVNWVENGTPPDDASTAAKLDSTGKPVFTRPLCAYPKYAKYHKGDANDAQSYQCKSS